MERLPLVVDRERLAGSLHERAQMVIGELELIDRGVEHVAEMERQADGVDGIPHADEPDHDVGLEGMRLLELLGRVG